MRKLILMTSAAVIAPISAIAQTPTCTATPDCASLGYTQSSCPENNGVRCPWGDAWFCTKTCSEMGFNYTCSGTGYASGAGSACGGKYVSCECAEGYVWENGSCVEYSPEWGTCTGLAANCSLGDILFSDGTCSANTVSGKTPIAVVVYKSGNCGQAMALKSIGNYQWGDYGIDVWGVTNYDSSSDASKDYDSCGNTAKIIAEGDKSEFPAAWAAHEYKTAGTEAGDWCLPAAGIFTSIYNNQSTINTGFTRAKGTKFTTSTYAWSSSEHHGNYAWASRFNSSCGLDWYNEGSYLLEVRPVLAF